MSHHKTIPLWFLAILTLSGTLAIHIFVPVLPLISQYFQADLHEVQLTLSVYHDVGVYLALVIVGIWLGTFSATRLVSKISLNTMMTVGSCISLTFAIILFMFTWIDYLTAWTVILPVVGFCFGIGLTSPATLTNSLNVNPKIAGSASGLYGFMQMTFGAVCTSLSGLGNNPAFAMACVLLGASVLAQICFVFARKAHY